MKCSEVRGKLVAKTEGELGTSEAELVERHLQECPSCAAYDEKLAASVPRSPRLRVPPDVRARLEAATRIDVLQARAERADPDTPWAWLSRPAPLSFGAAIGLVLVAASVGFVLAVAVDAAWTPSAAAPSVAGTDAEIPLEAFEEASYVPPTPADSPVAP